MDAATRYRCRACGTAKMIPERPLSAERSIRTGCEDCSRLVEHNPVGTPWEVA